MVPRLAWPAGVLMSRPARPPEGSPLLICLSSPFVHAPVEMPIDPNQSHPSHQSHAGASRCTGLTPPFPRRLRTWRFRTAATGRGQPPLTTVVCGAVQFALAFGRKLEDGNSLHELHQIPIAHNCRQLRFYRGPELSAPERSAPRIEHLARTHDVSPCKPPKDPAKTAPDCIRTCLRGESWVISLNPVAARSGKQSHTGTVT